MSRFRMERSMSMVKRQFHYRKPICPFISSTFQDFQAERDILMKKVFPALDTLCRERGTYCAPCDLRWGINDTQSNSGLVIQLCLDYVLKSMPFFICLMGERYGSHRPPDAPPLPTTYEDLDADAHWLDRNLMVAASAGYDWVTQESYQHCSVTELEIIQAAFLGESNEFCYFYFRQPDHVDHLYTDLPEAERQEKLKIYESESDYSTLRMKDLKARIAKKGLRIKYFKSPEELARIVLEDWQAVVERLYPPLEDMVSDTNAERFVEWMAHETFAETRRRVFVLSEATEELFAGITQFAETSLEEPPDECKTPLVKCGHDFQVLRRKNDPVEVKYKSILTLVSDRGCGKTSVVANWVKIFSREHPGITVFSHYVGSSALSTDVTALMRRAAIALRGEFQETSEGSDITDMSEDSADFYHLCETFVAALSLGPCVLVIDGIDELSGSYGLTPQQVKEMSWLPVVLPPQCKIILSTSKSDTTYKVLSQRRDAITYTVPLITEEKSKKEVVREHLAMHCKSLSEDQLTRIVSNKLSDRPIFLSILANELRVFGVYSRLDYHLDSYLEATSIRDLWGRIIRRWIKDYSWSLDEQSSEGSDADEDVDYTGWIADALRLIAASRKGLCQSEILDLLYEVGYQGDTRVTAFDWALFRSAVMDALFERPGGLLCFFHQHFREAVNYNLLGTIAPACNSHLDQASPAAEPLQGGKDPSRSQFHQQLANYFLNQPHTLRRTDELPWQFKMAGDMAGLVKVLSEPKVFMDLHGDLQIHSRKLDLLGYWKVLCISGYNASDTYLQMLKLANGQDEDDSPEGVINLLEIVPAESQVVVEEKLREDKCHLVSDSNMTGGLPSLKSLASSASSSRSDMSLRQDSNQSSLSASLDETEQASLCRSVGQFLSESGEFQHAESVLLEAHEKLVTNYPLSLAQQELLCGIEESLANLYLFQLKKDPAKKWYNKALETVDSLMEGMLEATDVRKYLEVKGRLLDRLGDMLSHERSLHKAETLLMQAKKCMANAGSITGKAMVQHHIGILRMTQKGFVEAEQCFRQAIGIRERWYGKSHPSVAEVLNDLAGLLCHQNNQNSYNPEEAEALYRRALRIREHCLGPKHVLVATTLFHLGRLLKTYRDQSALKESLVHLRRSLDIRTEVFGADHNITKAVQRMLSIVEASLRPRSVRPRSSSNEQRSQRAQSWRSNRSYSDQLPDSGQPLSRGASRDRSHSSRSWYEGSSQREPSRGRSQSYKENPLPQRITKQRQSYSGKSWKEQEYGRADTNTARHSWSSRKQRSLQSWDERGNTRWNSSTIQNPGEVGDSLYSGNRGESHRNDGRENVEWSTPDGSRSTTPGSVFEAQPIDNSLPSDESPLRVTQNESPLSTKVPGANQTEGGNDVRCISNLHEEISDNGTGQTSPQHEHSSGVVATDPSLGSLTANLKCVTVNVDKTEENPVNVSSPEPLPQRIPRNGKRQRKQLAQQSEQYLDTFAPVENLSPESSPLTEQSPQPQQNMPERHDHVTFLSNSVPIMQESAPLILNPCLHGAPPHVAEPVPQVSNYVHQQQCYIPGPHTVDVHNAYSPVNGPHNSVNSLMGPPPCPRNLALGVQHTSAWYHVPGRYPVGSSPYPPKRNQVRPSNVMFNSGHGMAMGDFPKTPRRHHKRLYGNHSIAIHQHHHHDHGNKESCVTTFTPLPRRPPEAPEFTSIYSLTAQQPDGRVTTQLADPLWLRDYLKFMDSPWGPAKMVSSKHIGVRTVH